jgi:hypothetical protein
VPAPAERSILAPSITPPGLAQLQVVKVLSEPRSIPLERFLTHRHPSGEVVSHPFHDEMRDALEGEEIGALAIYIRAEAPDDSPAADPLGRRFDPGTDSFQPWPPLTVIAGGNVLRLPCTPLAGLAYDSQEFGPPEPRFPSAR